MAFCVSCGNQVNEGTAFCGKCGAPVTRTRSADDPVARVAQATLNFVHTYRHNLLIAFLAVGGTFIAIVVNVLLIVFADKIGGVAGGVFLIFAALAAGTLFIGSLLPARAEKFNSLVSNVKLIDPVTGAPLRMLWWFRWLTAMITLWTFVGSTDLFNKPKTALDSETPTAEAPATYPTYATVLKGGYPVCDSEALYERMVQAGASGDDGYHRHLLGEPIHLLDPGCVELPAGTRISVVSRIYGGTAHVRVYLRGSDCPRCPDELLGESVDGWTAPDNVTDGGVVGAVDEPKTTSKMPADSLPYPHLKGSYVVCGSLELLDQMPQAEAIDNEDASLAAMGPLLGPDCVIDQPPGSMSTLSHLGHGCSCINRPAGTRISIISYGSLSSQVRMYLPSGESVDGWTTPENVVSGNAK